MFSKERPEWSPVELKVLIPVGLSQVSYHMKVLSDLGILSKTRTEPVRGSTKNFYASAITDDKMMGSILAKTQDDDKDFRG
jgi:hypothetical protein